MSCYDSEKVIRMANEVSSTIMKNYTIDFHHFFFFKLMIEFNRTSWIRWF